MVYLPLLSFSLIVGVRIIKGLDVSAIFNPFLSLPIIRKISMCFNFFEKIVREKYLQSARISDGLAFFCSPLIVCRFVYFRQRGYPCGRFVKTIGVQSWISQILDTVTDRRICGRGRRHSTNSLGSFFYGHSSLGIITPTPPAYPYFSSTPPPSASPPPTSPGKTSGSSPD